jgi:hypothetical protein
MLTTVSSLHAARQPGGERPAGRRRDTGAPIGLAGDWGIGVADPSVFGDPKYELQEVAMESQREPARPGQDPPTVPGAGSPAAPEAGRAETARDPVGRGGRIDITEASDEVQEASEESFPASDPPSYSPSRSSRPPGASSGT